ncbi:MAG: hypothetical protein P8L46_00265 [Acidimicrobiales bacterium]|nr:hypothetical protein [Acidimicrobiales bacterium]MDG2216459.1 hypothetical protein [Acidimicrobiales bacterium]
MTVSGVIQRRDILNITQLHHQVSAVNVRWGHTCVDRPVYD